MLAKLHTFSLLGIDTLPVEVEVDVSPGAPPDLATIVKAAGMPRVPLDPYSDQPLCMATLAGKPVIYSVGPDGKDDKAQVKWDLIRGKPGDFIFHLETTEQ